MANSLLRKESFSKVINEKKTISNLQIVFMLITLIKGKKMNIKLIETRKSFFANRITKIIKPNLQKDKNSQQQV